ncbi:MAG: prephenate dehydratase [Spirochaetia bacterium]|nr:prephenate dehydratase [Spirochaetia bacterium]
MSDKEEINLDNLRSQIDEIDVKLIDLLTNRAELAKNIALNKRKTNSILYRPEREQDVYNKIKNINKGVIDNISLNNIFREIMSAMIKLEGSLNVAYLGPAGSFTHQAAIRKFGHSLNLAPVDDIDDIFIKVEKGEADYGVIPIENSTEGIVNSTLDAFLNFDLTIYAEVFLLIEQNLLGFTSKLEEIETIYSHKQSFGQCKRWIYKNLPNIKFIETTSNSKAAEIVSKNKNKKECAIASKSAAETYGLNIIKKNIEDSRKNYTRFVIIGKHKASASGNDRTSIMFTIPHSPGSLYTILEPIFSTKINMTNIESRPIFNELWNYIFYIDLEGHIDEKKIKEALEKIKRNATSFRLLGSYPIDISLRQ